jgi:phosphomannomutase / phosphoglucomutase
MKIPFLSGKQQPSKSDPAKPDSASSPANTSLGSQKLLLMIIGVLLIAIAPLVVYLQTVLQLKAAEQEQAELAAALFSTSYRQWVATQVATAEMVTKDPEIARLMSNGDEQAIEQKIDELAYLFPSAIRVRLLTPGIEEVDLESSPPISYAALDMLKHAETKDSPPPVEVHMSGTPQQHINLVRRILDPAGRRIVGHLMVSYPLQELQGLLNQVQLDGYAEFQQVAGGAANVLVSRGDTSLKQGAANSELPISGSRWRIAYWSSVSHSSGDVELLTMAGSVAAVAAILLMLVLWLVFRKLVAALKRDQATLLTIVKDMRDGRARQSYAVALADMNDTIELMTRTAAAGIPAASGGNETPVPETAARSVDTPVVDDVEGDLLFDHSALDISKTVSAESKVDSSIFRAYDIRGIVGETLTDEVAFEIGRAIGSEAYFRGEQTVVVGRDGRLSGPDLSAELIRGLQATGRDVKDIGQVPTPVLYFAASYLGGGTGVMVTGSHNPADYNGFKIMLGGDTLANEAIDGIRQRIESGDVLTGEGSVEEIDVLPDYIERVKSDIQIVRPMKVVVDCGNGVAGTAVPQLLRELGCEVVELYCDVDGNFPNHHPDPSKTENLAVLIQTVQEQGADIGLAFDGDGDRLGVVSSLGEIIWPDRLLMLLSTDVLARNPGALIIYDVKSSRHVAAVVSEHGGEPLMWATGHSLIKAKMKETGALLAGEMSGHIFFKERWFGFDDALYSAARLLEILSGDTRTSSDVFAELPDSLSTPELNVPMAEGEPSVFMEKLLNGAHFENAQIATIDGLRVEFERGWGLVRASNTTPCLVLRFEAEDELALSTIQDEFRRVMLQADPSLLLPF